jgi:thiosulfate reductase cytochrome b subunit
MHREVLFYTVYERLWHWFQALGILLLLVSGFHIHYPEKFPVFGSMATAVHVHGWIGFLLLVNAFLGLFYTVTTNKIKEYIPMPMDFTRGIFEQARYYLFGMFRGEPHPFEKTPGKKLNPLQKITYFLLLNLLLPFQMVTGFFLWSATVRPDFLDRIGGLPLWGPLHALGAFFFLAFLVVHIYLTTTGPTPGEYLKQMIFGYGTAHGDQDQE